MLAKVLLKLLLNCSPNSLIGSVVLNSRMKFSMLPTRGPKAGRVSSREVTDGTKTGFQSV